LPQLNIGFYSSDCVRLQRPKHQLNDLTNVLHRRVETATPKPNPSSPEFQLIAVMGLKVNR
jgi:hypothetical protein